jgi:hypothetical protein
MALIPVELGRKYRDVVTGFEGVAASKTEYLNGCRRIGLERLNDKGDEVISLVFDEPNLEKLPGSNVRAVFQGAETGGPHDHDSIADTHR